MTRTALLALTLIVLVGCGGNASPSPALASASAATASTTASAPPAASPTASAAPTPTASQSAAPSQSAIPSEPPESAAPPSSAAAVVDLPATPVEAVLDQGYNTAGVDYDPDELGGLEPGDITARWYVDADRWVVHYDGLDLEETGPLCPGSSAQTTAGFEHVSNAPTGPGACASFDNTLATAPAGVRLCGDEVLYLTAIPADVVGVLYASIESQYRTAGSVVGLTSTADPDAGAVPTVDLDELGCEVVDPEG